MKNVHEIEIELKNKEWKEAVDEAFNNAVKTAKVDGFRQGKVPRNIFEKKYGKVSLYYDAINAKLTTLYSKVLKDNKLEPIMDPKIDVKEVDDDKLVISFVVTTKPEVKIKKYKNLNVKKEAVKVTKEEIDELVSTGKLSSKEEKPVETKEEIVEEKETKKTIKKNKVTEEK